MTWSERALTVDCAGETLVAVLSLPAQPARTGVVIVVGGPQYRAGSHRQFTLLARALAGQGVAVLRGDVRGMGDSTGAQRPFDDLSDDVATLTGAIRDQVPSLERVVLWGLCDGASAALLYLSGNAQTDIDGLVLVNPWVKTPKLEARARLKHYYLARITQADFWRRLLTGRIGADALSSVAQSMRLSAGQGAASTSTAPSASESFTARMGRAAQSFRRPILLLLSGQDQTAREFLEFVKISKSWQTVLARPATRRIDVPDADHTFSDRAGMQFVMQATAEWAITL